MTITRIFITTADVQEVYGCSLRKAQSLLRPVKLAVKEVCPRRNDVTFSEFFRYYNIGEEDAQRLFRSQVS